MNDDWRVQVTCPTGATAAELGELLRAGGFEHGLGQSAGERVIVSVDGHVLFLYAGTREQAERATEAVGALARASGAPLETELRRWSPESETWVDVDLPSAGGGVVGGPPAAPSHEEHHLDFSQYEVRVETESHRETVELSERLREQGIPNLRRWRYLLIGAADASAAGVLAERVRTLAPERSRIEVEASLATIAQETPPNPFAIFGGLGG